MEPESSLAQSQEPATCPYPERRNVRYPSIYHHQEMQLVHIQNTATHKHEG